MVTWAGIQPQAHLASDSSTYVQELDAKGETFGGTTGSWGHSTACPPWPPTPSPLIPALQPPWLPTLSSPRRVCSHARALHWLVLLLERSSLHLPQDGNLSAPRFLSTTPSPQSLHRTSYWKWSFCPHTTPMTAYQIFLLLQAPIKSILFFSCVESTILSV